MGIPKRLIKWKTLLLLVVLATGYNVCICAEEAEIMDVTPPLTTLTVGMPRSSVDGEIFVSMLTPFILNTSDTQSGVAYTKYRIDGNKWKTYSGAFTLSKEGIDTNRDEHVIYYYSVDRAGNIEAVFNVIYNADQIPSLSIPSWKKQKTGDGLEIELVEPADGNNNVLHTLVAPSKIGSLMIYYMENVCGPDNIGNVLEARLRVISSGTYECSSPALEIRTNSCWAEVYVNKKFLYVRGSPKGTFIGKSRYVDFSSYHNVRLVLKDDIASVYLDDSLCVAGKVMAEDGCRNRLRISAGNSDAKEGTEAYFDYIRHYSGSLVPNVPREKFTKIRIERIPPVTSLAIGEPKTVFDTEVAVSLKTPFTLTAVDTGSGIRVIKYRIDGGTWKIYSKPFTLESEGVDPGQERHILYCHSVDKSGNVEIFRTHLDKHVIALWSLDEVTGTSVKDSSGNGNEAVAYGTGIVSGIINEARSFEGGGYIDCGKSQDLNPRSFTISAWVYPYEVSGRQPIIFRGIDREIGNRANFYMAIHNGRLYCAVYFAGGPGPQGEVGLISPNEWYHIAFTYNATIGMGYAYVNGQRYYLPFYTSKTGTRIAEDWSFRIGTSYTGYPGASGRYFNGIIDEVCVSDIARTKEEIKSLSDLEKPVILRIMKTEKKK